MINLHDLDLVEKHTTQVKYMSNHIWIATVNLHPYDVRHVDTTMRIFTTVKPTARQLRKLKKLAMQHTRGTQRGYCKHCGGQHHPYDGCY